MSALLTMAAVSMCASTVQMVATTACVTEAFFFTAIENNAEVSWMDEAHNLKHDVI